MDRDESFDRLLKRTLHAGDRGGPRDGCLDPETLAAWIDGSLSDRQRAAAQAHAADCDRCLAALAIIARSIPPQTVPASWWSRWFSYRWLVPITAATAAVTLWIAVERRDELARPPAAGAVAT